jgi:hypothetical protein
MGVKMSIAYHEIKQRIVSVDEVSQDSSLRNFLYCSNTNCRVPLTFVDSHKRRYGNKDTFVRAYFRVSGTDHVESCEFNTVGQVRIIARDSDGLMTSIKNGGYEFRLNIVYESLKSFRENEKTNHYLDEDNNAPRNPKKVYSPGGKLSSYLNTMKRVVKLRTMLENNSDLKDLIRFKFNGKDVKWNNFYYETEKLRECYNYVLNNKIVHPICVEGRIKEIEDPKPNYKYYTIKLYGPWVEKADSDGVLRIPSISFTIYDNSIVDLIKREMEKGKQNIAIYSLLRAKSYVKEQEDSKRREYLNIYGHINHKNQVYVFCEE